MEAETKKTEDANDEPEREFSSNDNGFGLYDYAILLMPFYDTDKNVQQFFYKLLRSKQDMVKINAAVLMLRNNKQVADSIFLQLAAKDKQRGLLYYKLEQAGRLDKFPLQYKNQLLLAKSYLIMQNEYDKMDSVVFLQKISTAINGKCGLLYFFKYRIKKTDDWKIGISGLQPLDENELSSNDDLAALTDKKIAGLLPLQDQLNLELKKIVFSYFKSARNFFNSDADYNSFKYLGDGD